MSKIINRLYDKYADAVTAIRELEAAGISHNDISIVANNIEKKNDPTHKDAGAKGAGTGAAGVGAVGAGVGVLAGLGMLAIPGIGPVVAAGWLITALAGAAVGAGAGATAGGIIGKLSEYEVSKDDASVYMEAIRRGSTLVSVKADNDHVMQAEEILDRHRYVDIETRRQAYRQSNWKGFNPDAPPYTPAEIEAERARY